MNSSENTFTTSVYGKIADQKSLSDKSVFNFFPAYAKFLLDNKLEDFSIEQLKLSRAVNLPLLNILKIFRKKN